MSNRDRLTGTDPQEVAADWVARLHSGEMTVEDEAGLGRWLDADPAHRREYGRHLQAWAGAESLRDDPAIRGILDAANAERPAGGGERAAGPTSPPMRANAPGRRSRSASLGWVAAASIVAAGAALYLYRAFGDDSLRTAVGEIRSVTLADGSTVTLNTATRMAARMGRESRVVEFEQGEAFFDVKADARRPFVVRTPNGEVRVLGTQFNVRRTGSFVEVTVKEGRVEVRPVDETVSPPIQLTARQKLAFAARGGAAPRPVSEPETSLIASWRNGDVIFQRDTLISVISELGRYTPKRLVMDDPKLANLAVSGVFRPHGREGDVEGFIVGLQAALPLKATVFADHISIEAAE